MKALILTFPLPAAVQQRRRRRRSENWSQPLLRDDVSFVSLSKVVHRVPLQAIPWTNQLGWFTHFSTWILLAWLIKRFFSDRARPAASRPWPFRTLAPILHNQGRERERGGKSQSIVRFGSELSLNPAQSPVLSPESMRWDRHWSWWTKKLQAIAATGEAELSSWEGWFA